MRYSKYATTVIGAYSVPDWYEALDRLIAVGQLAMTSMADAQYRAMQAAVLDQEIAGVDVITGGEMHRRTHNRHIASAARSTRRTTGHGCRRTPWTQRSR